MAQPTFFDFLKEKNLISDRQAEEARALMPTKRHRAVLCLLETGALDEERIAEALSEWSGLPFLRVWKYPVTAELAGWFPKETATQILGMPLAQIGPCWTIAVAEPLSETEVRELRLEKASKLSFVLGCHSEIQEAAAKIYGDNYEKALRDVLKTMDGPGVQVVEEEPAQGVTDASILLSLTEQEPVVRLTHGILQEGVTRKASDIFVEPRAESLLIRYRVDGVLQEGLKPPKSMHAGVVSRLKIMSDLDIAEQRLPQDGRLKMRVEGRWVEFRISTLPTFFGEKVCLRILDPGQMQFQINRLGLDDLSLRRIKEAVTKPYGMILICGPTGSGKTTTLYSVLKHVDSIQKNLVTVEDPIEFHLDGINQVGVKHHMGLHFASALRSILRQDPDVILIGEIRDRETMDIGIKAALTGHLVLSTIHTNSAAGCITRMVNMGIEPFLITASVVLVGSQRLVRRLCPRCKEAAAPTDEQKRFFANLSEAVETRTLYSPKGCPECRKSGFAGRISVGEFLPMTQAVMQRILRKDSEDAIKEAARAEGMRTLRENALQKAFDGETSLEEALRIAARDEGDSA